MTIDPLVMEAVRRHLTPPKRLSENVIRRDVGTAVSALLTGELDGKVRPWDLPALLAEPVGDVTSAVVQSADLDALVVGLEPGGMRVVLRGVDDGWRLVRFVDGDDAALRPETVRTVPLTGSGPDAVLAALGVTRPEGVEMQIDDEDLGQGETRTVHRYEWTDGPRHIVAEEIKTEIFDGATPSSRWLRGAIVAGARGSLVYGRGDTATLVEG